MKLRTLDPLAYPASFQGAWVYFIREGHTGPIKIGYAWRIVDRFNSAQVGNPRELFLVGAIYVAEGEPIRHRTIPKRTKAFERALHQRFAAARIRGEWFHPVEILLDYIAKLPGAGA
jgi:hypothetical protein